MFPVPIQNLIICRRVADVNDHLNVPTHNPSPRRFFFNLELDNGKIKAGLSKEDLLNTIGKPHCSLLAPKASLSAQQIQTYLSIE